MRLCEQHGKCVTVIEGDVHYLVSGTSISILCVSVCVTARTGAVLQVLQIFATLYCKFQKVLQILALNIVPIPGKTVEYILVLMDSWANKP